MLIHDLTLLPTDRAPVASNRLILAQRRSLQSPKADAGGINQHRKRGQYLGVDFLHFGPQRLFSKEENDHIDDKRTASEKKERGPKSPAKKHKSRL
jgi:hypothetical protein